RGRALGREVDEAAALERGPEAICSSDRGRRELPAMTLPRPEAQWPAMPEQLRERLRAVLARVQRHDGLIGLLAGGSFVTGGLDEFSDLDLVVVVAPPASETVYAQRKAFAAECGPLLAAFTGEHVGEPRLLICLYGQPPVHVDLKFVLPDAL